MGHPQYDATLLQKCCFVKIVVQKFYEILGGHSAFGDPCTTWYLFYITEMKIMTDMSLFSMSDCMEFQEFMENLCNVCNNFEFGVLIICEIYKKKPQITVNISQSKVPFSFTGCLRQDFVIVTLLNVIIKMKAMARQCHQTGVSWKMVFFQQERWASQMKQTRVFNSIIFLI